MKNTITKVEAPVLTHIEREMEFTVYYESGVVRRYALDKLPKTAQEWLEEHPAEAGEFNIQIKFLETIYDGEQMLEDMKARVDAGQDLHVYLHYLKGESAQYVLSLAYRFGMRSIGRHTKRQALEYLMGINSDQAA